MRDIGVTNSQYYYICSGEKSATASYIYTLDRAVDADILREAVRHMVKRYHYFRLKPFVDENGGLFFEDNEAEPEVYPDDGTVLHLGTDETNGYMFRVLYKDNYIRVMAFHGMADGRGINAFGLSIVYEYLTLCGIAIDSEGMITTLKTPVDETELDDFVKRCGKAAKTVGEPSGKYEPHDIFVTPEERTHFGTTKSRKVKVSWKVQELLKLCHELGGTPVTVMTAVLGMAMHRIYDMGDAVMTPNVPIDLRPLLKSNAQSNFTTNVPLAYPPEYAALPLDEQVARLKEMLKIQTRPENLLTGMGPFERFLSEVMQAPLHDKKALDELHAAMAEGSKASTTLLLTNVGVFKLPKDMQPYVLDYDGIAPNLEYSPVYALMSMGDTGRLLICQNYDSLALPEEICKVLGEHGVKAEVEDCGLIWCDAVEPYLFARKNGTLGS